MTVEETAESLGVNVSEVREKQHLIQMIVKGRRIQKLSQAALAQKVGVTQGRIAQVESGIGTTNVSFDVLLGILSAMGYQFRIVAKKAA